jgi:hypothetical protein
MFRNATKLTRGTTVRRLLAALLTLAMFACLMPLSASAAVAPPTSLDAPPHFREYRQAGVNSTSSVDIYSPFSNVISHNMPAWSNASSWASAELKKADDAGLIPDILKGADLTKPITREEFAELAVLLYEKTTGKAAAAASPNPFKDTTNPQILKAFQLGITTGTTATTFAPKELINREQVATMLSRAIRVMAPGGDFSTTGAPAFTDRKDISTYAVDHVLFMAKLEIIKGVDGKFMPRATTTAQKASGYATATREQSIAMSVRSYEKMDAIKSSKGTAAPATQPPPAEQQPPAPPVQDFELTLDAMARAAKDMGFDAATYWYMPGDQSEIVTGITIDVILNHLHMDLVIVECTSEKAAVRTVENIKDEMLYIEYQYIQKGKFFAKYSTLTLKDTNLTSLSGIISSIMEGKPDTAPPKPTRDSVIGMWYTGNIAASYGYIVIYSFRADGTFSRLAGTSNPYGVLDLRCDEGNYRATNNTLEFTNTTSCKITASIDYWRNIVVDTRYPQAYTDAWEDATFSYRIENRETLILTDDNGVETTYLITEN